MMNNLVVVLYIEKKKKKKKIRLQREFWLCFDEDESTGQLRISLLKQQLREMQKKAFASVTKKSKISSWNKYVEF